MMLNGKILKTLTLESGIKINSITSTLTSKKSRIYRKLKFLNSISKMRKRIAFATEKREFKKVINYLSQLLECYLFSLTTSFKMIIIKQAIWTIKSFLSSALSRSMVDQQFKIKQNTLLWSMFTIYQLLKWVKA